MVDVGEAAVVGMNIEIGIEDLDAAIDAITSDSIEKLLAPMRKALGMKEMKDTKAAEKPAKKEKTNEKEKESKEQEAAKCGKK